MSDDSDSGCFRLVGPLLGGIPVCAAVMLAIAVMLAPKSQAEPPADSPRWTPLVNVVRTVRPSMVSLFVPEEGGPGMGTGSGTIIHPDGFVLTNHHVVTRREGFAVYQKRPVRFQVVGRLPEKDLAVVKLQGVPLPLPVVALGRSGDVMMGESVAVVGSPGGRGTVVTAGVVSSDRVFLGAANELVMTQFPNSRRDPFIQFDAASNRGNSGGALLNMESKLIGVVSALIPQEQNSSFAIPVDRVRTLMERVIEPELLHQKRVGVELNPLAEGALIAKVIPGSAADRSGMKSADLIRSVNGRELVNAADWMLSLHTLLPSATTLNLDIVRDGEPLSIELIPQAFGHQKPVDVEASLPGLKYSLYYGEFETLPVFSELNPVNSGATESFDLGALTNGRRNHFGLTFSGYLRIPEDGLYRVTLISDDGSRLSLHGKRWIDHDGNHPPMPISRLWRAKAGMHPIRIEYFQGRSGASLDLRIERLEHPADHDPENAVFPELFHLPPSGESSGSPE